MFVLTGVSVTQDESEQVLCILYRHTQNDPSLRFVGVERPNRIRSVHPEMGRIGGVGEGDGQLRFGHVYQGYTRYLQQNVTLLQTMQRDKGVMC